MESYSESFQKSVTTVPITSKGSDDTFAVETGSGREISMTCSRVHPASPDDSGDPTEWTNAKWYRSMQAAVDRWQMRTDGALLDILPDGDNPYIPTRNNLNGYISRLSLSFRKGENTQIVAQMEFATGRMYMDTELPNPISGTKGEVKPSESFFVMMSSPSEEGAKWYYLYSEKENLECLDSYALTGGMECPFEILELTVPKRSLELYAPGLVDNIIAGKSRIQLNAMGEGMFTVTKCRLSGKNYLITAYSDAYTLTGHVLEATMTQSPFNWISYILEEGKYGVAFTGNHFKYAYAPRASTGDSLTFNKGTNIWYILQVCSIYLGCRLFFTSGTAYLVDCRGYLEDLSNYTTPFPISDYEAVDLYPVDSSSPYFNRIVGNPTLGDEGWDTIVNSVAISCKSSPESTESTTFTYNDTESIQMFQEHLYQVSMPNMVENSEAGFTQAETMANSLMDYRKEPQQSVTFKFKEMRRKASGIEWQSTFAPVARVPIVYSIPDGFVISNRSVLYSDVQIPQKLMMSTYTRNFPEGTTTYTFGQITKVDLTSSTSNLSSSVKN